VSPGFSVFIPNTSTRTALRVTKDPTVPHWVDFQEYDPLDPDVVLVKPSRRRKKNQSSIIKRALRAAVRAGFEPIGFRVGNTGEVTVFTKVADGAGRSSERLEALEDVNEWDEVKSNGAA
jgi:hypothetical protein